LPSRARSTASPGPARGAPEHPGKSGTERELERAYAKIGRLSDTTVKEQAVELMLLKGKRPEELIRRLERTNVYVLTFEGVWVALPYKKLHDNCSGPCSRSTSRQRRLSYDVLYVSLITPSGDCVVQARISVKT
jgi:hypothetical protein